MLTLIQILFLVYILKYEGGDTMKYVLADIKNGKIHGLYGGRNEKYTDIYNYVGSANVQECGHKFSDINEAIKVKRALDGVGFFKPQWHIIVVETETEERKSPV